MRRYFKCLCQQKITGTVHESERYKLELLMNQAGLNVGSRAVEQQAHARSAATSGAPATAIELSDGTVITGKTGPLLGATASALINALKALAGIPQETDLVSAAAIEPIQTLKTNYLGGKNPVHTVLDPHRLVQAHSAGFPVSWPRRPGQLPNLKGLTLHSPSLLSSGGQQHPEPPGDVPDLRPCLRGRGPQVSQAVKNQTCKGLLIQLRCSGPFLKFKKPHFCGRGGIVLRKQGARKGLQGQYRKRRRANAGGSLQNS